MSHPAVVAVVVTRDRRDLLTACLGALREQTHPLAGTVVVDNASSDGTPDLVRDRFPEVTLLALPENTGGAGGFHRGMQAGHETGADWLWILDDDTIAAPHALQRLVEAPWETGGLEEPALLASRVNWTDGQPHPMNTPIMRRRDPDALARAAAVGLLPLRATTFVSLLVARTAITRYGLPRPEYFFQADDIEFTARILRAEAGYLVPDSVVEHRTASAHTSMDDPFRFYHHLRNTVFQLRGVSWSGAEKVGLAWVVVDSSARFLRSNRFAREAVRTILRALLAGVRGPGAGAIGT